MILTLIMMQVGFTPPPPAPRPHADIVCNLYNQRGEASPLAATVEPTGESWDSKVEVKVNPKNDELVAIEAFRTEAYGDSFKALSIAEAREVHYYFTMPQSNGTNGYVRVLEIRKGADGLGPATWVATGLCNFHFKALDE
jgi:hypothetical protein